MSADCAKLTVYFGESDRVAGALLSDLLFDLFEKRQVLASSLLRGVEGFGVEHQLRTDRFLTLSEDLPLAAVAVAEPAVIDALLPEVSSVLRGGLITTERATLLRGALAGVEMHDPVKLTLYLGRDEPYVEVVGRLRRAGLAGATVLLGVDGTVHGQRRRARFFSRNSGVPLLVIGVGTADAVRRGLGELDGLVREPVATLERVRICKRDGELLARPDETPAAGWQKLMVYVSEQAQHDGHPVYVQLIRRLREQRAGGATSVRGIWGFSGEHEPHGDRLFRLRRRVPVVTTIVDEPDAIRRWFDIVDELTGESGLVTCEAVPEALRR
ncbi:MAG: DUF190 domain-containing protein [Actinomycetota bacterium]